MQNLRCHKIIIRTCFIIPNLYHYLQIFNTQVTVLQFMFFSHVIFKVLKCSECRTPHANSTHMFQQFAIGCMYIGGVETYLKLFIHQVWMVLNISEQLHLFGKDNLQQKWCTETQNIWHRVSFPSPCCIVLKHKIMRKRLGDSIFTFGMSCLHMGHSFWRHNTRILVEHS